jgi:hypothetical protein
MKTLINLEATTRDKETGDPARPPAMVAGR